MRRVELLRAAEIVRLALDSSGVQKFIREGVPEPLSTKRNLPGNSHELFDVFGNWMSAASHFSAAERTVGAAFELNVLEDTRFWLAISMHDVSAYSYARERIDGFVMAVHAMTKLLSNDATRAVKAIDENAPDQILSAILIEERNTASRPERVISAIKSITQLYEVCAFITNVAPDTLSIIACDSGSDKSFDFLGASAAIRHLKELILGIWDRAVVIRQTRAEANINAVLKTLTVVDEIARLQGEGRIDNEACERMKYQVVAAASQFLDCGVVTADIEANSQFNPRIILAPQPKLLSGSLLQGESVSKEDEVALRSETEHPMPPQEGGTEPPSALTAEEDRILKYLLKKSQGPATSTE